MKHLLFNFLQPQGRISPVVIASAVVVFIAGVSLLVYFYQRYKRIEKEPEEDWDSSRRSLFVNVRPPATKSEEAHELNSSVTKPPIINEVSIQTGGTRELTTDSALSSFSPAASTEPEPQPEIAALEEPVRPKIAPPAQPRPTEILASPSVEVPAESVRESNPFSSDKDLPRPVEVAHQPPPGAQREIILPSTPEPRSVARVDQRSRREPFEPPRIERILQREPYEAPTIEPLTPRETSATRELRTPKANQPGGDYSEGRLSRGTVRFGSASEDIARALDPPRPERETRELAGQVVTATAGMMPEQSVGASQRVQRAGSILGLPAEPSHQPLILGERVQQSNELGIGALTNYGKDIGPRGGRAGTIVLLLVVALLGAAVGLYFFVPSVHSRVGAFVAHLRGTDTQAALEAAMKPKAQ
ncbi:MAG TPA: hypothetical protein VLR92_10815, partial [Blastocatellia bacterium]|nr:hypothetical protein [Blastocatellia bacterium]